MSRLRERGGAAKALALALLALLVVPLVAARCEAPFDGFGADEAPEAWVEVRGVRVATELAITPDEQARGLGHRDELPWGEGMLFLYERPDFYRFWMRGMRFAIDIVWIHRDRIVDLSPNVPFERGGNGPIVAPRFLVDRVLEVPAGFAAASGWRIGDAVKVERLPSPD